MKFDDLSYTEQGSVHKLMDAYRDAPPLGPVILDKLTAGDLYMICEKLLATRVEVVKATTD